MRKQISDLWILCSDTTSEPQRLYGEQAPLRSSYRTHVLHAAMISDFDSIMFVNRIREISLILFTKNFFLLF